DATTRAGGSARGIGWGTLGARVIVVSALMTLAIIAGALTLTYVSATRILERETAEVVEAELRGIVDRVDPRDPRTLIETIRERSRGESEAVYLLADAQGSKLAGNLNAWPADAPMDGSWIVLRVSRTATGEEIDIGARAYLAPYRTRLLVGRDLKAQRRFEAALVDAGLVALLAAVLLAAASGFVLNRLVMRRIGDIGGTAQAIVAGDLARRIPARPGRDEFSRLALTLNGMLERIEALVTELRTVTESMSHDLRTPLTRLKTQIQRA